MKMLNTASDHNCFSTLRRSTVVTPQTCDVLSAVVNRVKMSKSVVNGRRRLH